MQLIIQVLVIVVQAMLLLWLHHISTHQNLHNIQKYTLSQHITGNLFCQSCLDNTICPYDT